MHIHSWTGNNSAFLAKSRTGGGSQFSWDPLNLQNKHSFKVFFFFFPFRIHSFCFV